MANIVTHTVICAEVFPDASPEFLLGNTLPDFADMYSDHSGTPLNGRDFLCESMPHAIQQGVRFHRLTDETYDSVHELTNLKVAIIDEINNATKKVTSPRACAYFGVDLMIDAAIYSDVRALPYQALRWAVLSGETSLEELLPDNDFANMVLQFFKEKVPENYSYPKKIAKMAHRRFRERRGQRLAFNSSEIGKVAKAYERNVDLIHESAHSIVDMTVEKLLQ